MTARNWSSPASSGTGAGLRGSGPRRRGAACGWTAPARGSRTARRRGLLRLSGVVHVVGGPDVLHGRVLAALPSQRSSNLVRGGRQGCCSFCQAPRYPKAPPTPSAATATLPSTSCARCPASSRRRSTSLGRPMICGGGCAWPGRGSMFRRTYLAASLDQPDRKATSFVTSHFYLDDFVQSSKDQPSAPAAPPSRTVCAAVQTVRRRQRTS